MRGQQLVALLLVRVILAGWLVKRAGAPGASGSLAPARTELIGLSGGSWLGGFRWPQGNLGSQA